MRTLFVGTKKIGLFVVLESWLIMFYYGLGGKLELLCIIGIFQCYFLLCYETRTAEHHDKEI